MSWATVTRDGGGKLELPYGVSLRTIASYIVDMWGSGDTGTIARAELVFNFRTVKVGDETVVDVDDELFRFKDGWRLATRPSRRSSRSRSATGGGT